MNATIKATGQKVIITSSREDHFDYSKKLYEVSAGGKQIYNANNIYFPEDDLTIEQDSPDHAFGWKAIGETSIPAGKWIAAYFPTINKNSWIQAKWNGGEWLTISGEWIREMPSHIMNIDLPA